MVSIYIIAAVVLLIVLAVFVLVQVKTAWYWRLASSVLLIFASGWSCYQLARVRGAVILGEYNRNSHEIVEMVDQLAVEGRTNDVHQICQKYLSVYVYSFSDLTNLDSVFQNAADRVAPQTFELQTLQKP